MTWIDLLFAHWTVDPDSIKKLLPRGLELDLFDGKAYLGVVPFLMTGVRPRICPPIKYFSNFPELNVRTYVVKNGKPGVWFFSLDAGSKLAVRAARATYNLPYFDAEFDIEKSLDSISYRSVRTHRESPNAVLQVQYSPLGQVFQSAKNSLEYWLTERYCLYAADKQGNIYRGEINHLSWPLQMAKADISLCNMTQLCGFELKGEPTSLLFSSRLDVHAWALEAA